MCFHVAFSSTEFLSLCSQHIWTHLTWDLSSPVSLAKQFLFCSKVQHCIYETRCFESSFWKSFAFLQFFSVSNSETVPKLIWMGPLLEISLGAWSSATRHWQNGLAMFEAFEWSLNRCSCFFGIHQFFVSSKGRKGAVHAIPNLTTSFKGLARIKGLAWNPWIKILESEEKWSKSTVSPKSRSRVVTWIFRMLES